jgi:hypothetical protein
MMREASISLFFREMNSDGGSDQVQARWELRNAAPDFGFVCYMHLPL